MGRERKHTAQAKPEDVAAALHGARFDSGLARTMTNGVVQFDDAGLNTLTAPMMVQWHGKDIGTVWPQEFSRAKVGSRGRSRLWVPGKAFPRHSHQ